MIPPVQRWDGIYEKDINEPSVSRREAIVEYVFY